MVFRSIELPNPNLLQQDQKAALVGDLRSDLITG